MGVPVGALGLRIWGGHGPLFESMTEAIGSVLLKIHLYTYT